MEFRIVMHLLPWEGRSAESRIVQSLFQKG
jgi:hypothetical protein